MERTSNHCICINLRQTSLALTRFYDTALEPSGLKVTQYSVLKNARNLEPVSISRLAEECGLDRTTLGRNLRILEREKLVVLGPSQEDQREHSVRLTEEGQQALDVAYPLWREAQRKVTRGLGKDQLEVLNTLLTNIEATIE